MIAVSYPFGDVLWTLLALFGLVILLYLLFTVWADVFRRDDLSGWAKVSWLLLTVLFPVVGVLVYLISQHGGMVDRDSYRPRFP
ncbi:MAG TPA: PLDc N-terminal domain-containing protein [Gaiellaceae bacterium]|nr:PLDc N-terminal domain-containing protein [Gaiellaceae bacterium]